MNKWIEKYERYLTLLNKSERTIINYTKTLKKIIKDEKIKDIKLITGFKEITVCEDETTAYEYWKNNFNPNKDDCCNLRV